MIPGIFDNSALFRTGWALLHFLWQGTLIALALKGALMLIEQRSSSLRYTLALSSLFLMAALPVFLLCRPQSSNSDIPATYETIQFETMPQTVTTSSSIPIQRKPEFHTRAFDFAAPLAPWIALCWLSSVALLLLKTIGGVIQVRVLKQKALFLAEGTASFHRLASRAGVPDIPILESDQVFIPTVAGWFKPVVLLPRGALNEIGRPMLDALVAHEFAHIRRHDSMMNLIQTVIENLLFFHPAMWWITWRVRAEREACCDDDAVTICGDRLVYVHALSRAEQFRSSIPVIALSSSPLLHRIRRLTEMKISKMNHATAFCIALLSVSFIIGTAAGSILLAAIPPQNTQSNVSVETPGGNQFPDEAEPGSQGTQPDKESKYALVCGVAFVKADKANVKPSPPPPPPSKDKNGRLGSCFLLDVSTSKASIVHGELQASELIHKVNPIYPETAVKEHVGIRVTLHINVNEEGIVTDAEVTKSQTVPPDRDSEGNWVGGANPSVIRATNSAAIDAAKQWEYSPTLLNGNAVPVRATASITFTFNEDGSPKIIVYAP